MGAEVINYTDFEEYSLRVAPIIGLGTPKFRISYQPHFAIINKDFPLIKGAVSLSVNFILDKKEIEKKKFEK